MTKDRKNMFFYRKCKETEKNGKNGKKRKILMEHEIFKIFC
jgi:hypothetical protein